MVFEKFKLEVFEEEYVKINKFFRFMKVVEYVDKIIELFSVVCE